MRKITLGEVLEVRRGTSLSGEYYAETGKLIRLTLGNFKYPGGGFKENTSKADIYFTGDVKPEYILRKGDIITPLTEQVSGLLGETATIPEDGKYIQSGDVGLIIPDEEKLDRRFAYYLVSSPIVKKQLDAAAQQTKIRHTSPDAIKGCEAWIPEDIETQKAIGKVLDDINTKIINNASVCSDLESMAKLIYDYWFVQFDFPDENGRPYKSSGGKMFWNKELKREIPEGWEVTKLREHIELERGISYSTADLQGDGIPMINLGSFAIGGGYKEDNLKTYSGEYSNNKIIAPYDLIICLTQQTSIDPNKDVIGCAMLVPDIFDGDVVISQDLTKINCSEELKFYLVQYFNTSYFHRYISGFASGSNILHLDVNGILNNVIVIPPKNILDKFEKAMEAVFKKRSECVIESQQLASLRDFLLPMLMNGQVKVGKAGE